MFAAEELADAAIRVDSGKDDFVLSSTIIMLICGLVTLLTLPALIMEMKGPRRVLIVLQQVFLFGHHIFVALPWLLRKKNFIDDFMDTAEASVHYSSILSIRIITIEILFAILRNIFQYQFYLTSLMQSMDVYKMVCSPFDYKEYSSMKNLIKQILVGTMVCLALCLDTVARGFLLPAVIHGGHGGQSKAGSIAKGIAVVEVVKTVSFKILYSIAICRLAYMTKKGLSQSFEISQDAKRKRKHQRIFYFTLIPFFLNLVFVGQEVMDWDFQTLGKIVTQDIALSEYISQNMGNINGSASQIVRLVLFSLGSFAYTIGLFILFPHVRKMYVCHSQK